MWLPAACCSKAKKQARLVARKDCLISDAGSRGGKRNVCPKANSPPLATIVVRAFMDRNGLRAETAYSALIFIFHLLISDLIRVILVVLGTLNLQLSAEKWMLLNYGVGEDSGVSLGLQGHPTSPS